MNAFAAGVGFGAAIGLTLATVNVISRTVFGTGWVTWSLQGLGTGYTSGGPQ